MADKSRFSFQTMEKVEKLIKLQMLRFARRRRLLCRSGYYIEIRENGVVRGTKDMKSPYTILQVLSIGSDMLAFWGMEASLYLAVSSSGILETTSCEGRHCVFLETVQSNFSNTYDSYQSVSEGLPRRLTINNDGLLGMRLAGACSEENSHFIWEMVP